jgi:hypothetical protein
MPLKQQTYIIMGHNKFDDDTLLYAITRYCMVICKRSSVDSFVELLTRASAVWGRGDCDYCEDSEASSKNR